MVSMLRPFFSSEANSRLAVDVKVLSPGESCRTARHHRPGGAHRPGSCSPPGPRAAGTEHKLAKVGRLEVATCGDIIVSFSFN